MEIKVALKSIGKRKPSIEPTPYKIQGCPATVRELILAVTEAEVTAYNRQVDAPELLPYMTLSKEEMTDNAQTGKIAFGTNYGKKKANLQEAQTNAIQCFEDGIYRIFLDNEPLDNLDTDISITEHSIFTFVRLTMLAGRMW